MGRGRWGERPTAAAARLTWHGPAWLRGAVGFVGFVSVVSRWADAPPTYAFRRRRDFRPHPSLYRWTRFPGPKGGA